MWRAGCAHICPILLRLIHVCVHVLFSLPSVYFSLLGADKPFYLWMDVHHHPRRKTAQKGTEQGIECINMALIEQIIEFPVFER